MNVVFVLEYALEKYIAYQSPLSLSKCNELITFKGVNNSTFVDLSNYVILPQVGQIRDRSFDPDLTRFAIELLMVAFPTTEGIKTRINKG